MMKKPVALVLFLIFLAACSSRQIVGQYEGATAQRLTSHSVNNMIANIPEKDFSCLEDKKVYLSCYFLNNIEPLAYAQKRLELELMDKYQCRLVPEPSEAEIRLHVFFTSLGTDTDEFGLHTPELVIPGLGGFSQIDVISLEMFHGITELYYYIVDDKDRIVAKSDMMKTVVRNDSLSLPVITIPIVTGD
ncbi:MAG: hypothetical protein KGY61_10005 [Desulfobacterales bacterium]|nr:hypothetical protein [Desulfobacterales bacterium]